MTKTGHSFFFEAWWARGKEGEGLRNNPEFLRIRETLKRVGGGSAAVGMERTARSSSTYTVAGKGGAGILTGDRKAPPQLLESPG